MVQVTYFNPFTSLPQELNQQMSNFSCSGPLPFNDDQYLSLHSPFESAEFQSNVDTPMMENNLDVIVIGANDGEPNGVVHDATAGTQQANAANNGKYVPFTKMKRKKTSGAWAYFVEVTLADRTEMHECIHCWEKIKFKDGTTTPIRRHIVDCPN